MQLKNFCFKLMLTFACFVLIATKANAACYEDRDEFKGVQYHWCGAWGTGGTMLGGLRGLDPMPYFSTAKSGPDVWFIKLISSQSSWSNISAGDKLVFKVDDEVIEFTINMQSLRNVDTSDRISGPQAVESVIIGVTRDFLVKISSASNVQFALYTKEGRQERTLLPQHREHYADLLKKVDELKSN